jgi:hypothetical protein
MQWLIRVFLFSAIPASALDEENDDDDDESGSPVGDERDDERTGTKYNVSHNISRLCLLLTSFESTVCLVPHHLCPRLHVCRHASHRLAILQDNRQF